jgi:antitoxin VapB
VLAPRILWYISNDIYRIAPDKIMSNAPTAKIFKHGRSQAVRLPKEFRMPGTEMRVRRVGRGLLLEPIDAPFDVKAWFDKLDEYHHEPFMPEGRQQPAMPTRKIFGE